MGRADWFYAVATTDGRWTVRHQLTDLLAGTITRTSHGYRLKDEHARDLGGFDSVESALEGLYGFV